MLDRTQKIKGFALPAAFIRAVNEHTLGPEDGPWVMRDDRDAFNHPIEMDLSEVYQDMPTLVEENEHFAVGFEPSDEYGMRNIEEISVPGAIADIELTETLQ